MKTEPQEKYSFFLYARKSSESEDRQVQSIDDQISRLKELAKTLNLNIKEILTESKSAKKPYCRPSLRACSSGLKKVKRMVFYVGK